MVDHFEVDLAKVLTVKRTFKKASNLRLQEKELIKQQYLKMRADGKVDQMYEILRNSGDSATIEKVVDFLKTIELELNVDDEEKVLECVANSIPDLELRHWTLSQYKRGFGYQVEKQCKIWGGPLFNGWIWFQEQILPFFENFYTISCPHLDWFKDLLMYFGLRHFCDLILVSWKMAKPSPNLILFFFYSKTKTGMKPLET